jgi:hypothetical protein
MPRTTRILPALALACLALPAGAATFPCQPCAGLRFAPAPASAPAAAPGTPETAPAAAPARPEDFARLLKEIAKLEAGSPVYLAWESALQDGAGTVASATAREVRASGGMPWIALVFTSPAPLAQAGDRLQGELRAAAELAGLAPAGTWFQIVWRPEGGTFSAAEYAFLVKRAAVALTGAQTDAQVAAGPLPLDPAEIRRFYGEEVEAYLEAVVLPDAAGPSLDAAIAAIAAADPGRPIVIDGASLPLAPEDPAELMAAAARNAARGAALTLFGLPDAADAQGTADILRAALAPLTVLAREFKGDLSYESGSAPSGAEESWVFVRGNDLALRVIALAPAGATSLALRFNDPALRRPIRYPISFRRVPPPGGKATAQGLDLDIAEAGRVIVLGLERASAEEMKGVSEKITISGQRDMPVEEILRRLQAFEDAQGRKLDHFQALNTTHLRFQPSAGAQTFEATLEGPYFWTPKTGADWAWQSLYVNGVKWRGKTLPEIPLIQPEKAAALPLEIHFAKQYRYRLRGSDKVGDRDAWVIDFAPAGGTTTEKLYQGSVWVDKLIYARLKTRAVQIGLEGEVLSNEETFLYSPIDRAGQPAPWSAESYVLPLRLVAQQILSVVNASTVVERETVLTRVQINGEGFEAARKETEDSEMTMVRDTDKGLRYLVKDEKGEERVVKEGFDRDKLFLLGGVFYDDSLDFPLPLAGVNYLNFDLKGSGKQLNVFFGGALLTASFADPRAFGSRFDLGLQAFALAIPLGDSIFQNDREDETQEIEQRTATFSVKAGHPLGNFVKLNAEYQVLRFDYSTSDNTAKTFALPSDNFTHAFELGGSFSRAGYGFAAHGSYARRSEWEAWGFPGNPDFDPDKKDFLRWDARASKNWYLSKFRKVGLELDYVSGSDLDRFSKYQFGFFGSTRVHGYQSNRVRASEAFAAHLSYGFEIGQTFRLEGIADGALASDEDTGLENELLGGVGIQGTFLGPWQTIINLDVGLPVAGPDDGFVAYIVFLKLFR